MPARNAPDEEVLDSPVGWVAKHVQGYLDSDGVKGARYYGQDALLLTTRGRRSGQLRRTALYYGRDGERFILVASNGGSAKHPLWYLNILDEPRVEVQAGAEVFAARARSATIEERPRLWELVTSMWPQYATYQKRTQREIPVVVVERIEA